MTDKVDCLVCGGSKCKKGKCETIPGWEIVDYGDPNGPIELMLDGPAHTICAWGVEWYVTQWVSQWDADHWEASVTVHGGDTPITNIRRHASSCKEATQLAHDVAMTIAARIPTDLPKLIEAMVAGSTPVAPNEAGSDMHWMLNLGDGMTAPKPSGGEQG